MTNSLSAATLAIYIILTIPVLYLLFKHRRHGISGWFFLFLFCTLQIIGSALGIKSASPAAGIISNVGLSPLLLATAGILHEARIFRIHKLDQKIERLIELAFHMLVIAGVALTAAGSVKLQNHEQPIDKAENIVKAGIAILAVSWGVLVGFAGVTFTAPRARNNGAVERAGSVLLGSVCFSLVFIGVRVFYSVAALSTQKPSLNPTTGTLAVRVVLGFLPSLIATISYVAAGITTQGSVNPTAIDAEDLPLSHKHRLPSQV